MPERLNYTAAFPEGFNAMQNIERALRSSGVDHALADLMKIRASQLNGCAYCLDMHTKDARARGESEQRIYALDAWRETPFFTTRERSALAWTEALTNIQQGHAPDAAFQDALREFGEAELVKLTFVITQINAWNRLAIAFRAEPGNYQPKAHAAAAS